MAIRACLAKISPLDPATGNRVNVYLSSVNDRIMAPVVNGLGGFTWTPALKAAPLLTIQLWNGDFQAAVDPGSAQLALKMEAIKRTIPAADTYFWIGAPVEIYAEAPGVSWPWTARFKGTVESLSRQAQDLALTASVGSSEHDKDVLTASYAGTGGAEGGADLKNKLKPLVIGWAKNVEPVLVDAVNNVHQFSGYGAIENLTALYERGSAFSAAIGNYASYATLIAATIPPGKWATCDAQGMIRLGAPAYGVITADLKGHKVGSNTPRLTGQIISALATIAGVSSGVINSASLTALETAVPFTINVVIRDQTSWLDIAKQLALACNYQAGLSLTGSFFAAGLSLAGTEVVTLDAQGKALPQVTNSDEQDVSVPYYKTIMGANRAWRVHTADEIAFNSSLIDKGSYDAATTYRDGFYVTTPDGSQWVYINATPSAGNAPPTWPTATNTYWANMAGPPTEDVTNMLRASVTLSNAQYFGGAYLGGPFGAINRPADRYHVDLPPNPTRLYAFFDDPSPCIPGETLYVRGVIGASGAGSETAYFGCQYLTQDGAEISSGGLVATIISGTEANNHFETVEDIVVTPAGAGYVRLYVARENAAQAIHFYAGEPYLGRAQPGADITLDNTPIVTGPGPQTVLADVNGSPKSGQLPRTLSFRRASGSVDRTSVSDWTILSASGLTATINNTSGSSNRGQVNLSGMASPNTELRIRSVYRNVPVDFTVTVSRQDDPPLPPPGTKLVQVNINLTCDNNLYDQPAAASGTLTIASGEKAKLSAPLQVDGNNSTPRGKWQRSPAGANTWTDVAGEAGGIAPIYYVGPYGYDVTYYPGSLSVVDEAAGLSAGSYDFRLLVRQLAGTPGNLTFSGTVTMRAEP